MRDRILDRALFSSQGLVRTCRARWRNSARSNPERTVEHLIAPFAGREAEVDQTLEAVERDYIIHVLKKVHGKIAGRDGAAAKLGMKRTTLQSRLSKLGIRPCDY